jgi:hypothetical protein
MTSKPKLPADAADIVARFEAKVGLQNIEYELRDRTDGPLLSLLLGNPTDRFFQALKDASSEASKRNKFRERITIRRRAPETWVHSPEARLLQRVLSESLTVGQHSFEADFFDRYIPSVAGAESQIVSAGNHIVFGRRGSGKSSLLVYAMRKHQASNMPIAWVAMQTYDRRSDVGVAADIATEILEQVATKYGGEILTDSLLAQLAEIREKPSEIIAEKLRLLIPGIKKALAAIVQEHGALTIFLDDFHVVSAKIQPEILSTLYAFCRGNKISLKVSGIEQFTRIWDPSNRIGLEVPNDAQVIRLDYNLTKPDKSLEHISNILAAHAQYCGLPSIGVLCHKPALSRLIWVAAGVPRDAINIFVQAMIRAANEDEKHVSITGINLAASQAADDKMRFVEMDSSGDFEEPLKILESIRKFCTTESRTNAFLIEIRSDDPLFENVRKLIDLRFLHVLHPGITPDQAGVRWQALLLDYGFYTGVRAGKSIDLFQAETHTPEVKELRKLPRFREEPATSPPRTAKRIAPKAPSAKKGPRRRKKDS